MALSARVRFGATASSRVPRVLRGETVEVWCDFYDEDGAAVDVSGVTATVYYPGGSEAPTVTPTEETAGTWRADVPATLYSGLWKITLACDTPSAALATSWFSVEAAEPDVGPAPEFTTIAIKEAAEAAQEAAETAQSAAETAQAAAEAAQAASEGAASSSLGPMSVTSVGGTADGDGNVLIYTGTLSAAPQLGSEADFIPSAANAAGPRLRPTVGGVLQAQVAIRDQDGNALVARQLLAGRNYRLRHDGTNWRAYGVANSARVVKSTSYSWTYAAPAAAVDYGQLRVRYFEQPGILFDTGDGTSASGWTTRFGWYDGAFRIYDPRGYLGPAALGEDARILTDHRPPLTYQNVKRVVGAPSRMNNRTSPQRVSVGAGGYIQAGGMEQHAPIVYGNGAWIDFVHLPKGGEVVVIPASSGAVPYLYTGEGEWGGNGTDAATLAPHSWVNTGTKLLVGSAGAWLTVRRDSNGNFLARVDSPGDSVADGTGATMPAHDLVVAWLNQSWVVDLMQNGGRGAVRRLGEMELGTDYCSVDSAPIGGSSLLYFAAKATLFLWDQRTDTPGRRLLDFIAAVQADQTARTTLRGSTATAVSMVVIAEGLNGMGYFGPASTHPDNCPSKVTASYVKMAQYIDAQLGANLLYVIVPLTSQKLGTFAENLWHPMRMAQLRAPAAGADADPPVNIIVAPDIYGDPRSGDEEAEEGERHYDFPAHAVQMERIIDAWANETLAQDNYLGPEITGTATADAGVGIEWDVTIDYGAGRAINQATRPESAGFRLLPAATGVADADDFATPLTILATRWVAGTGTTIKLRCTLDAPYLAGTPRPSVLWGSAEATDQIECVIYALHPVTSKRMYLRQFLSGG